jgi:hypothetical protein
MSDDSDYLYGDSTPSTLKTDFIALLRDVIDFGVTVLQCDGRLTEAVQRAAAFSAKTEKEIESAEALVLRVSRALEQTPAVDAQSLPGRCAVRIQEGAADTIRAEIAEARAAVAGESAHAAKEVAREHEASAKALATLLLKHELPDEVVVLHLQAAAGASYKAELHAHAPFGLDWVVALEIPPSSPLAQALRIERVAERLEVQAPEEAGWLRKETKIRAQRLDRLYLTQLTVDPAETLVRLRTAPDATGGGFDISFRREPRRVQLVRVFEGDAPADAPYEVEGDDAVKLRALQDSLAEMASSLRAHKKSIVSAKLADIPVDKLEPPRALVDRIVEHIAPTVQEIGRRSLTPGELVLKRRVSESHREELFISRAEVAQKLEPLSAEARRAFDALGLAPRTTAAPAPLEATPHVPSTNPSVIDLTDSAVLTETPNNETPTDFLATTPMPERNATPSKSPRPMVVVPAASTPPRSTSGPPRG